MVCYCYLITFNQKGRHNNNHIISIAGFLIIIGITPPLMLCEFSPQYTSYHLVQAFASELLLREILVNGNLSYFAYI